MHPNPKTGIWCSSETSGSNFLVAHTQLADHNQCRDNAICVSPGPMKIYLDHGRGGTIWPTSWPAVLWGQMPVWDETSLFAARELSSTPMLLTGVKRPMVKRKPDWAYWDHIKFYNGRYWMISYKKQFDTVVQSKLPITFSILVLEVMQDLLLPHSGTAVIIWNYLVLRDCTFIRKKAVWSPINCSSMTRKLLPLHWFPWLEPCQKSYCCPREGIDSKEQKTI